jgi:electron-transferring-flavoprotein dehydrogenase
MHTMGYPLEVRGIRRRVHLRDAEGLISLGFVAGLDYRDPMFDPHVTFQRFKQHPFVTAARRAGSCCATARKRCRRRMVHGAARAHCGGLIAGDAGGFMNSMRLKGIHLAMRTGMLAAETAFEAVKSGDVSRPRSRATRSESTRSRANVSCIRVRNVHQAFGHGCCRRHVLGLALVTAVVGQGSDAVACGPERMRNAGETTTTAQPPPDQPAPVKIDRQLTFDKVTNVHLLGHAHREDEPSHSHRAGPRYLPDAVRVEYGNPCTRFCPAHVYEMVDDGAGGRSCTSTRRTACTARRATSWIRTKSSTGCRRKAAKAPVRRHVTLPRAKLFQAAAIAASGRRSSRRSGQRNLAANRAPIILPT